MRVGGGGLRPRGGWGCGAKSQTATSTCVAPLPAFSCPPHFIFTTCPHDVTHVSHTCLSHRVRRMTQPSGAASFLSQPDLRTTNSSNNSPWAHAQHALHHNNSSSSRMVPAPSQQTLAALPLLAAAAATSSTHSMSLLTQTVMMRMMRGVLVVVVGR